jgi:TRAP-type C4-dicarboxylate transport system substrate-binding protein
MATLAPEGTDWYGLLVEMGQEWKARTNGEVTLRIYPGGVVGDERDMVRKMRIGQIHGAAITAEGLTELNPDVTAFFIPLLFQDYDEVDLVRSQIAIDLEDGIKASGFKVLYWADVGWAYWFSTAPIVHPEDLRKMKMFSWAGDYKTDRLWEKGGFKVVPLASTDILHGLKTGLIDAIATTPLFALSTQVFGVANYMLEMKWGLLTAAVIVDLQTWNGISPHNREIMEMVANKIGNKHKRLYRDKDTEAIEIMKKHGLVVRPQTEKEFEAWDTLVHSWYSEMRGSFIPKKIFDRVTQILEEKITSNEYP